MRMMNVARGCGLRRKAMALTFGCVLIVGLCVGVAGVGQAAAQGGASTVQQAVGTVKATSSTGFTLTTTAGQDVAVEVPASAKVLVVAPGSRDLSSATVGTLSDIAVGDRALISGDAAAQGITALRVILMKAQAIAASRTAEQEAWQKGGGGIVKSVDTAAGKIVVASGQKMVTVQVTPQTVIRRYASGSVRFADASPSTIAEIHKGDQLLVRGAKSADGSTITADALVAGSFGNYSGLIVSIDQQAGTITLSDLVSRKKVTVAVTAKSDLRALPQALAERFAAQMRGKGHGGSHAGPGAAGSGGPVPPGAPGPGAPPPTGAAGGPGQAGMDLSHMLSRLPTETLTGLKVKDAVMIVATAPGEGQQTPQVVTLLTGVEPILTASPKGQQMTLSPWSLGGGAGAEGGGGGGAQQ